MTASALTSFSSTDRTPTPTSSSTAGSAGGFLKPGGVLIWDDYLWRRTEYGRLVPKLAIDQFLTAFRGQYAALWAFKQVAIRKSKDAPA